MPRRGFERPPWWVAVVAVVGIITVVAGLPVAVHRGQVSAAVANQMRAENSTLASKVNAQIAAERPLPVLVIGDSYTGGSAIGGYGARGWPAIVHNDLAKSNVRVAIQLAASGGSGYCEPGPNHETFVQLATESTGGYRVVVFFGSRNDVAPEAQIAVAARQAFAAVKAKSPDARLLVIGPPWVDSNPPAGIIADRNAVRSEALAVHATFLDPLADGWFTGRYSSLIGADGVHPTDAGHAYLASKIEPTLLKLLLSR